jgi:hypothetical protein
VDWRPVWRSHELCPYLDSLLRSRSRMIYLLFVTNPSTISLKGCPRQSRFPPSSSIQVVQPTCPALATERVLPQDTVGLLATPSSRRVPNPASRHASDLVTESRPNQTDRILLPDGTSKDLLIAQGQHYLQGDSRLKMSSQLTKPSAMTCWNCNASVGMRGPANVWLNESVYV